MHRTDEKKPTGSFNFTAGGTDTTMVLDTTDTGKAFASLAARFALAGHTLTLGSPADGAVIYYVGRWGLDLQAVAPFLAQIGGSHG
jgi:hypothetical protein